MNCPVKDEMYLCETPCMDKCPYQQGAREFAEWLCQKSDIAYVNYKDFATATLDTKTIDELLAEWQKGAE